MKKAPFLIILLGFSILSHAQIVINEICPANADIKYDPDYFNFSGWIELYNKGNASVNVGGYYLSDDLSDKFKWRIPSSTTIDSKGYLLIWCDNKDNTTHTNFSLDIKGEDIILSDVGKTQVDKVTYPKQFTNISYGRSPDGSTNVNYLSKPTPSLQNDNKSATIRLDNPSITLKSGRYSSSQTTTMSHSVSGASIHYTVDGTEPTISSPLYSNGISVSSTSTIKAKAFHDDFLPSKTEVKTFFINEHPFTLPVISLSLDQNYLWDNTFGIYTDGTNGMLGNCQSVPKNWNQDWSRHGDFEYFKSTGDKDFDQSLDVRIGGACSRAFPQKSLVMRARDEYGSGTIKHKFFKTKSIGEYGSFILRNSGNDFNITMFRDALEHSLVIGQMDIDYLAYQPTTFYINGQYWGIQNLREKIDGDYIKANYGIDASDIDLLEFWGGSAIEGDGIAYQNFINDLQQKDLSDPATFNFIDEHIDVQEFINYLTTEIYYGNTDWPGNNVKFWRQRSTNGKFRWILWDMDFGFELFTFWSSATHPTLDFATDPNQSAWPNPAWSTLQIRLLLQNPVFKARFIQTLTTAMQSTFKPDRVISMIDNFADVIKTEMPYHKARWGGTMDDWNYEVQRMRDFATARNVFMKTHTANFFGLTDEISLSVSANPSGGFKLNGVAATENIENAFYFKGIPYQIEPIAPDGFVFKNWKITTRENTLLSIINKGDNWKYFDQGASPGASWQNSSFNDNTWSAGPAQLGYGDGDEQTVVSYGADASNKYVTTYFRKQFNVDDLQGLDNLNASVLFDDGVIIYLNGTEVYRSGLPTGTVDNTTYANVTAETNVYSTFTIDKNLLVQGTNILAAEIHQVSGTSSDISFDLEVKTSKIGNEVISTTTEPIINDTAYSDVIAEVFYEPATPIAGIVINEFCASNSTLIDDFGQVEDWIELYNNGNETIDLAGLYITDDLTTKNKHKISAGDSRTILSPGEYIVLYADETVTQGALHLGFKLSGDGDDIGLYQVLDGDVVTLDELTFEKQTDNASTSRIPNITGSFIKTGKATPKAANIYQVVTSVEEEQHQVSIYPIPSSEYIFIKSDLNVDEVIMHDTFGRAIRNFSNVKNDQPLSIKDLNQGLYIVKVRSGKKDYLLKFIKQD
jgi:hypothetical protein